ncbi:nuclease-related domain-containing protein [Anaerobacillus isosaccharinicus]|uniref:NERD domain-containing protein n=1 Tax=Anaerobacillus isosaccharinicus TaxID=1532552 RepID=A0A1S2M1T3_9BACI|nr:nuclease-related domain-containing protein [Anaerobacillus isosaccharinicus]MBA5586052.1 NERD domain-containing protein [Anaerobacillus isosaccharinicus]QOY35672.1 NERD domain-containing protein [Anaerobacillus isosaccharinicus]
MIIKLRSESKELRVLRCLNARLNLSEKDKQNYYYAEKGIEGERKLDDLIENVSRECLIISDLLLECNNTFFQIDTVLIHPETIFLLEVKNYQGIYYIEENRWYKENGKEIKNPLLQLSRCEVLFRQWLQQHKFNFNIQPLIVFIHPEFTLFNASRELPIVLPTQINNFLKKLNNSTPKLMKKHERLSELLLADHQEESPYSRLPDYHYDKLQKGVICQKCYTFMNYFNKVKLICPNCGSSEKIEESIVRSVEEYKLLFPERKITVSGIRDWCLVVESDKIIRRILQGNFKLVGKNRYTHYI